MASRHSYFKATRADKTSTFNGGVTVNGNFSFGDVVTDTFTATGNMAITTADKLTVGGNIIPQEIVITYPLSATTVDANIFVADDAWIVTSIEEVHTVAGNDGSAVTLMVDKCTTTDAPGAGTDMIQAVIDLKGTANTTQTGTLSATPADYTLADGDRIAVDVSGTLTSLAGGVLVIHMKRA